jgi:hypothetical protein
MGPDRQLAQDAAARPPRVAERDDRRSSRIRATAKACYYAADLAASDRLREKRRAQQDESAGRMNKVRSAFFLMSCALLLGGCGRSETATTTTTSAQLHIEKGSIGACLMRGGASLALSTDELDFLAEAEADDELSKVSFAFDRRSQLFVNVWKATRKDNRPPRWIVWFARPFDSDKTPLEVAGSSSADGYVLFLDHPTPRQRSRTDRCIRIY